MGDSHGVFHMPFHAECQGVQADHGQVGVKWGLGGPEIYMVFTPDLVRKGQRTLAVNKRLKIRKTF